jgi:hypothetical protein
VQQYSVVADVRARDYCDQIVFPSHRDGRLLQIRSTSTAKQHGTNRKIPNDTLLLFFSFREYISFIHHTLRFNYLNRYILSYPHKCEISCLNRY